MKANINNHNLRIMLVDDDSVTLKILDTILSDESTFMASDGQKAVHLYNEITPDIIFLDIDLPKLSGHQVLERILSINPHAQIIMLSSNTDMENISRSLMNGATAFISKPIQKQQVLEQVANYKGI